MNISDLFQDSAIKERLDKRAEFLAMREDADSGPVGEEILTFSLGRERFGLPVQSIQEVYPLERYTRLPATPTHMVGLVNVRGRLLAIVDLRPLLDLPVSPASPTARILIVSHNAMQLGLLADAVDGVRHTDTTLEMTPSTAAGRGISWVRGVDQRLTLVLDPSGMLADPRLIVKMERPR